MRTSQATVVLTDEQRGQLETLVRSRTVAQQTALRCRIILQAARQMIEQLLRFGFTKACVERFPQTGVGKKAKPCHHDKPNADFGPQKIKI